MMERCKMHQGRLFPSWNLMDTGLASPSPTSWSAEVFFFLLEQKYRWVPWVVGHTEMFQNWSF